MPFAERANATVRRRSRAPGAGRPAGPDQPGPPAIARLATVTAPAAATAPTAVTPAAVAAAELPAPEVVSLRAAGVTPDAVPVPVRGPDAAGAAACDADAAV
jgi:hypothetical protein